MKFFIIFINVVLPTNLLCQVYQIDPLIISMAGIEIKNGTVYELLSFFIYNKFSESIHKFHLVNLTVY